VKKHQRLLNEAALPDLSEKARQYLRIDKQLAAGGYVPVGIDHFAKPTDGLAMALAAKTLRRNFMGYTDLPNDRLIAFGASSISEMDQGIAQNIPQATSYRNLVASGKLPTIRGWTYRDDDVLLRCRHCCHSPPARFV
jgi:oxygen-independent coproporphyrinogen-3 oxidase